MGTIERYLEKLRIYTRYFLVSVSKQKKVKQRRKQEWEADGGWRKRKIKKSEERKTIKKTNDGKKK